MRSAVVGGLLSAVWMGLTLVAKPVFGRPPATIFSFSAKPRISQDADADGLPDDWEVRHGLNPHDPADAGLDIDGDGLNSLAECRASTDPWRLDSNHDGLPDGAHDGSSGDASRNGLPDAWMFHWLGRTDLDATADPDGDGLTLQDEWRSGLHPTAPDVADPSNHAALTVHRPTP